MADSDICTVDPSSLGEDLTAMDKRRGLLSGSLKSPTKCVTLDCHDCHDCLDCLTRLLLLLEPLLESLRKEIWRQEAAHGPPNYTVDNLRRSTSVCVHLYTRYALS